MPSKNRENLTRGRESEEAALNFLQRHGLKLVERNFRCRVGELDLIMEHDNALVFVEVRYRKNDRFGSALESIDRKKQTRLIRAAGYYLGLNNIDKPARFDVVAVSPAEKNNCINWIRDAFQA
ncbi:MAG: YraN family protein [Pseudomonadota bacterium]